MVDGMSPERLEIKTLRERVSMLESVNLRLRVALALLNHIPPRKKAGRPLKNTQESDRDLLMLVGRLQQKYERETGHRYRAAKALRLFATERNLPMTKHKLNQEIKTIQNVLARAKKIPKNSA